MFQHVWRAKAFTSAYIEMISFVNTCSPGEKETVTDMRIKSNNRTSSIRVIKTVFDK